MESLLGPLLPLLTREREAGRAVVLGLLVHTAGSTYRKAGALMLIAADGDFAGLLSGGCLEGDLRDHAQEVLRTGQPQIIRYDMRGGDDLIWGLGLGCEGAMHILLLRVGPAEQWQPLAHLASSLDAHRPTAVGIVIESDHPQAPVGTLVYPPIGAGLAPAPECSRRSAALEGPGVDAILYEAAVSGRAGSMASTAPAWTLFALPLCLPPKLLLLGAGPDAAPVVEFAARLNWKVTLVDHRPGYADTGHFPAAEQVILGRPDELLSAVDANRFAAAVVMSHHLPSDLEYLRALALTRIPYVGLLGPAVRRERLLGDLGPLAGKLVARLHAPVGLRLGGRTPEAIALAIVAQIHAELHDTEVRSPEAATARRPADAARSENVQRGLETRNEACL